MTKLFKLVTQGVNSTFVLKPTKVRINTSWVDTKIITGLKYSCVRRTIPDDKYRSYKYYIKSFTKKEKNRCLQNFQNYKVYKKELLK